MRMLCVVRHRYLSEHLCRYFDALGMDTVPCVGLRNARALAASSDVDVMICDYDLLVTAWRGAWASEAAASRVPILAVSLTRQPGDAHVLDVNRIGGFLYLPTLSPEDAHRAIAGVRRTRGITPPNVLPWPGQTAPQLR